MAEKFLAALRKSMARKLWKIAEEDNIGFTRDKANFFDAGAVVSDDDSEVEDLVNKLQTAWEKKGKKDLKVALKANKARSEHFLAKRKGYAEKGKTKRAIAGKKTRAKVPGGGTKSRGRHQVNESEEEAMSSSSEDSIAVGDDELDADEEGGEARARRSTKRTRDSDEVSDGVENLKDVTGWAKRSKRVRRVDAEETVGDAEMAEVDGAGGRVLRGVSDAVAHRQIALEMLRATQTDWTAFTGLDTTATEISVLDAVFKLGGQDTRKFEGMSYTLVEGLA